MVGTCPVAKGLMGHANIQSQSQSQIYFIQDQEIHYLQSVGYEN